MTQVDPLIQDILEAHGAPKARPEEPSKGMGTYVWYRGWECGWNAEAADWGFEGWDAYKGGCDLGAPHISGRTWIDLLDEIDAEEFECADCPMASPADCMLASYCPHRGGGKCYISHPAASVDTPPKDRVVELPAKAHNLKRRLIFPLNEAKVRKPDVDAFWRQQPFDLELPRGTGNCDHCPFVSRKARVARLRLNPAGLEWWKQHESERNFTFGWESFAEIEREVASSPTLLDSIEADAADSECVGWCAP